MKPIRILIADDHPLIIAGFIAQAKQGLAVVAETAVADDVLPLYDNHLPDIVVLDIAFGDDAAAGLTAATAILAKHSDAKIIFYTQHEQKELIRKAYQLGGRSFVTKKRRNEDLAHVIKEVYAGRLHFLPEIAEKLALLSLSPDDPPSNDSPRVKLDPRELQVFCLIAQGFTSTEIATELALSVKTISGVTQSIKNKVGLNRPADMARLAIRHKLVDP
jgi:DNA-binding NarL/FixJ family response regulator